MDGFGDNFTGNDVEVDPAAEFLAREQDQLAGLEDDIPAVAMTTSAPVLSNVEDDLSGNFENMTVESGGNGTTGSFEMINTIDQPTESFSTPEPVVVKEEPEKIKKWREEQAARLEEKDAEEEKKKEEWKIAAKKELEEWYKHHAETTSKTKATNRGNAKNAEKQFVAEAGEVEPGTEWERIAKLCDFNPKSSRISKDVSRMRSIILQLKQSPPATTSMNV
ncbi:clathrin light chain isoform X1 [Microplitis mediator]|uniref:clathrin light chain isoform X1 n=1 Tax=Microplitis mediator TaxID=375433 RepID=UPI0025556C09|nr:clathrin light chain isoform X1 [Microplitis mediator]XP_057333186.1 clathrin light chain isoform X1 [Microplitis mediator]XP_057333193.1 clathrin light chain isoform X1 [Microplitis mediator]